MVKKSISAVFKGCNGIRASPSEMMFYWEGMSWWMTRVLRDKTIRIMHFEFEMT
jgi:hypothetical protein